MTTISKGIFTNQLEWTYILSGVGLGVVLIIVDAFMRKTSNGRFALPVLAVGIGIYLPPSINMPVVVGAVMAWLISRHIKNYAKRTHNTEVEKKLNVLVHFSLRFNRGRKLNGCYLSLHYRGFCDIWRF